MSTKAKRRDLKIVSQNVRGLKSNDKIQELFGLVKRNELFAVCLQETWRKGHAIIKQRDCLLITNGIAENIPTCRRGKEGVAIALSGIAVKAWKEAGSVLHTDLGSRIISIRLCVKDARNKIKGLYLVSAYAPVGAAKQNEWDDFLAKMELCISRKPDKDILLIGCDTNSSLGIRNYRRDLNEKSSVGKYGLPHRNKAGTRFNTFLEVNSLIAVTTYFQKKDYMTWRHPRSKLPHQIDHIISEKKDFSRFTNASAACPLLHSDHKSVNCCLRIASYFQKQTVPRNKISRFDSNTLSSRDRSSAFNTLIVERHVQKSENYQYHDLAYDMFNAATKTLPIKARAQPDWFEANENELLNLIEQRNSAIAAKMKRNTRVTTT